MQYSSTHLQQVCLIGDFGRYVSYMFICEAVFIVMAAIGKESSNKELASCQAYVHTQTTFTAYFN